MCLSFLKGVSPQEVCLRERERAQYYLRVSSELKCFQKPRGREEGREGRRERERPRGDELFEAERVVKLRLVPTKTGETGQLWEPGWRPRQVSLAKRLLNVNLLNI